MIYNSIAKKGKAKSAKFKPNFLSLKTFTAIIDKISVKKINNTEAIFNNIIQPFYHKNEKRREFFLAF